MPKKPTIDDARLILELYDLRREAEMRKARQWWLITFWPKCTDDFVKVATAMGSEENNWLRQVGGYWSMAVSFVLNGVVSEKLFFQVAFCGEMYFIFAKVRPFLPELREKMKNPELFLTIEKAIMGSKLARTQFEKVEARVAAMRQLRAEVQGEWGGRAVPLWREDGDEAQRKGLLAADLEKAPGEYELKVTGQMVGGEKMSCSAMVTVRKGLFATEKLQVGKEFVEPSPEQIQRANEERQKLREIFDRVTPERLWDGKFRIPLDGVTTGSNFGKRRILNGNPGSPHSGMDLPGTTGTPVHATQRGRVALAEELFFSGNTIVLDHGLGIYTFYGHLSEIDVKAGDALEAGAVLGKVGATGRVTGPHLHWGLTVERARVNPLLLVMLLGNSSSGEAVRRKSSKP